MARAETLKNLLVYCHYDNLCIHQINVETAFLNGQIKPKDYVKQPNGFEDGTDKVFELKKSLYGLHESPRSWYDIPFLTIYLNEAL